MRECFGIASSSLARVAAEVVCDEWGAVDRLNELVRWGWVKASKADALAGLLVRRGEGHKPSPGTALGRLYGRSASLSTHSLGNVLPSLLAGTCGR